MANIHNFVNFQNMNNLASNMGGMNPMMGGAPSTSSNATGLGQLMQNN